MKPETAGMIVCGVFILIAIVCAVVDFEARKRKQNVRLPRRVSWDRASKYYYGDTE